jgi:hypothetical protein
MGWEMTKHWRELDSQDFIACAVDNLMKLAYEFES